MKRKSLLFLITIVLVLVTALSGCSVLFPSKDTPDEEKSEEVKKIVITFDMDGVVDNTTVEYTPGEAIQYPNTVIDGYVFKGWYLEKEYKTKADTLLAITKDVTFYAKWDKIGPFEVELISPIEGATGTNITQYSYGEEVTLPQDWALDFYTFIGWYDNPEYTGDMVNVIPKGSVDKKTFYAKWEAQKFVLSFNTKGGKDIPNKFAPYNELLPKIETPTKEGFLFDGWYLDEGLTRVVDLKTYKMPSKDITLYAKWVTSYAINYYSDNNKVFHEDVVNKELNVIDPVGRDFYKPLYYFDGWFLDEEYTQKVETGYELSGSVNLYAKWTQRGFAPYMDILTTQGVNLETAIDITEDRMFAAVIEYIAYTNTPAKENMVTHEGPIFVKYKKSKYQTPLMFINRLQYVNTSINVRIGYDSNINNLDEEYGWTKLGIYDTEKGNRSEYEATSVKVDLLTKNTIDKTKYEYLKTMNDRKKHSNFIVPLKTNGRNTAEVTFPYQKNKGFELKVKTSNDLFYAFQYGYYPNPEVGSSAYRLLEKAKTILKNICNDEMSDFEKVYAIYTWFVKNVKYDHTAVELSSNKFKIVDYTNIGEAWHLEGVFDSHLAVCDGISKAFTVLCGIEGIPCLRVVGQVSAGGHAWNKLYLDADGDGNKEWQCLDATWGVSGIQGTKECVITYENFLFTEADRASERESYNQLDVTAEEIINPYRYLEFTENEKQYNYEIESNEEIKVLAKYIHNYVNDTNTTAKKEDKIYLELTLANNYLGNVTQELANEIATLNLADLFDNDLKSLRYSIENEIYIISFVVA